MINKSKTYLAPLILTALKELSFNDIKNTFLYTDFAEDENLLYLLINIICFLIIYQKNKMTF